MSDFESRYAQLLDGRRVCCWLNRPAQSREGDPAAILMPGFGKRMHQHSGLAQYLVANGVAVVRFDSVNHVGLSDGEICKYTLTDGLLSLEAAMGLARRELGERDYSLIATSLTARMALRRFGQDAHFSRLIVMSGVLDVRHTFRKVFGVDYTVLRREDLPEFTEFWSNTVSIPLIYEDGHKHDWFSLRRSIEEVRSLDRPAIWFAGTNDEWVDRASIEACIEANASDHFNATFLRNCGHDIGRNSPIARRMMHEIVTCCRGRACEAGAAVIEPSYDYILHTALQERRAQRRRQGGE